MYNEIPVVIEKNVNNDGTYQSNAFNLFFLAISDPARKIRNNDALTTGPIGRKYS